MIVIFKYWKVCHTEEGNDLISVIPECRTQNNNNVRTIWLEMILEIIIMGSSYRKPDFGCLSGKTSSLLKQYDSGTNNIRE